MLGEFRWNIVIRVAIITGISLLLAYVLTTKSWFFTPLVLIILLVITIWNLILYIERINKDLTYFILSIKQSGFTTVFPSGKRGRIFKKLAQVFNDVIEEFRKVNLQKETHYQYLQLLTENIQAGIISFDHQGNVELLNPAAKQLLGVVRLANIKDLDNVNQRLGQTIRDLSSGQRKLLRIIINRREFQLSVQVRELVMNDKPFKVLLIQDLNAELEEREVEAWQKLTRVLTHEIMNSVTPIVSLTEAINTMLKRQDGTRKDLTGLDTDDKTDLYEGMETIENRSRGLLRFVNAYKDFVKTPELYILPMDVSNLINRVATLFASDFTSLKIDIDKSGVPGQLAAHGDPEWLEQVLINVLKNAVEALETVGGGQIKVEAGKTQQTTFVRVIDNGPGIDKATLDNVFVPFFTTKRKGSGIGLSLSRQIMRLHRGVLEIQSEPGAGTKVELRW